MANTQQLEDLVIQVRRDILSMVHKVNSGHPGGSLGCAEFFVALYLMKLWIEKMDLIWMVLEKIFSSFLMVIFHLFIIVYLPESGYFEVDELNTFRLINSRLQGHPTTHEGLPGIRIASGSLGQGMSVALGAAQAKKLNNDSHLVYSLHGDGELQEGQNWEAIMYAAGNKVDNIICTVDLNGQQIDGSTDDVLPMGSIKGKFEAFGWVVIEIEEGNNIDAILKGMTEAKSKTGKGKPVCVLLKTVMGNGVDFMMHTHAWHGKAPNDEQLAIGLAQNAETLGDY